MKIALVGSYGAGKTTLAKGLATHYGEPYQALPPMSSPLDGPGREAVDCSRPELVELLTRRLIDRASIEVSRPFVISDGSLLHDWIFVRTLLLHGSHPDDIQAADTSWTIRSIEPIRKAIHSRIRNFYDRVIYLPIEFRMADASHPVSERFRALSDIYLLEELGNTGIEVTAVQGPLAARLSLSLEVIGTAPRERTS